MDRRAILDLPPSPPASLTPPSENTAAEPLVTSSEPASPSRNPQPAIRNAPTSHILPCANCAAPLAGPYCAQCGQHVADYHRSLWRLLGDFFDNTFCWDNKLLRTLGPLLRRPGFLTREFLAGRRVRYVHPLRLFLFTSAVCLTLLQFGRHGLVSVNKSAKSGQHGPTFLFDTGSSLAPADAPDPNTAQAKADAADDGKDPDEASPKPGAASSASPDPLPSASPDELEQRIEREVKAKIARVGGEAQLAKAMSQGVQQRLSWVVLALLPVFALGLRALYWHRDSFYFGHLVFSLHYHTFLLLFAVAYTWLGWLLHGWAGWCLLAPPVYLFLSLRRVHGGSGRRTFAKVLLLGSMHLLTILLGLAAVGALAFFSAGK